MIFKDPITDDGTKKSLTGCVVVRDDLTEDGSLVCRDGLSFDHIEPSLLETTFLNGELLIDEDLATIRERLADG